MSHGTKRYGVEWDLPTELDVDFFCYANYTRVKQYAPNLPKLSEITKGIIKTIWPEDVFTWHYWVDELIEVWCNESTAHTEEGALDNWATVWGPGGSGKSTVAGLLALVDWWADPVHTTTQIYTTSLEKQSMRAFGEAVKYFQLAKNMPGKYLESKNCIVYRNAEGKQPNPKAGIYARAILQSNGRIAKVGTFGVHNKRNNVLIDEMQATPKEAFDSLDNATKGGRHFRFFGFGNPEDDGDLLVQWSLPLDRDLNDLNVEKDLLWRTTMGVCLRLDGHLSPRIIEENGDDRLSFLIGKKDMEFTKNLRGGENSPEYLSQCRGFITNNAGGGSTVLTRTDIRKNNATSRAPERLRSTRRVAGLDPAFSNGGDAAMVRIAEIGYDDWGYLIVNLIGREQIAINSMDEDDTLSHQLARGVHEVCQKYGVLEDGLAIDVTAQQISIHDIMKKDHGYNPWKVNSSGAASKKAVNALNPDVTARDMYHNKATELAYSLADFVTAGHIRGLDEIITNQVTKRKVIYTKGRRVIEDKKSFKTRVLSGSSPDDMDACCVMLDMLKGRFSCIPGLKKSVPVHRVEEVKQEVQQQKRKKSVKPSFTNDSLTRIS